MKKLSFLALASTLALAPALAALAAQSSESQIEAKRTQCLMRASTTNEMKQCEYSAFRAASAELHQVQTGLQKRLKKSDSGGNKEIRKRLKSSNRAWMGMRDSHCRFKSAEVLAGSEESLLLASCSVNLTIDRIKELRLSSL